MTDFTLYAGDSKTLECTVRTSAGVVVDITDFTEIRWVMASSIKGPPLLIKSVGSGVEIINAVAGRFDVTLDSADTEGLARTAAYYHEAEIKDPVDDVIATVFTGRIVIKPTLIKP